MLIYSADVAGLQQQLVDRVRSIINAQAKNSASQFNNFMTQIWDNQDGLTPQQVMDGFGTDFVLLNTFLGSSAARINGILGAGTVSMTPLNGHTYVVNPDGTGTVTA